MSLPVNNNLSIGGARDPTPLDTIIDNISEDFKDFEPLNNVSRKFGVKSGQLVLCIFPIFMILILIGAQSTFVIAIVGFSYPAYMSIKALETKTKEDDLQWLTYWVVFGFMHFFEAFLGIFLPNRIMTHLNSLILIFMVWMFYPKSKGATTMYNLVVRKIFIRVDETLQQYFEAKKK